MRSHLGWGGERSILYKGVETSPKQTCFKNLEGKPKRKSLKRTISVSSGLRAFHMVLEPDTWRCTSEEAEHRKGVDTRRCASKDARPRKGVD